jgi:hypothetical protein
MACLSLARAAWSCADWYRVGDALGARRGAGNDFQPRAEHRVSSWRVDARTDATRARCRGWARSRYWLAVFRSLGFHPLSARLHA